MRPFPVFRRSAGGRIGAGSGRTRVRAAPRRSGALLMQSTVVNRARSEWRGPGSRTGDPWCPGYRTGRPEKAGEGPGRRTGRTKSPGITLARKPKSWGNTLLIVMVSGVFLCPLTPKYHILKRYFFRSQTIVSRVVSE